MKNTSNNNNLINNNHNNTMNTKQLYKEYIIEQLKNNEFITGETPKDKANHFLTIVKQCHGNYNHQTVIDHLQGLGHGIDIDYMNYDIIQRATKYGLIETMLQNAKYSKYKNKELALERVEDQILADYWKVISNYILQIAR